MDNFLTPEVFISYSWKNSSIADEIDKNFQSIGLLLRRDIRDATYRASIKEFMQKISKTDFVLMIISDEYLHSENCMYEVLELINSHEFEKRILPIVLDDAQSIFKGTTRSIYYDYWKAELNEAGKRKKKHPNSDTINQVKQLTNIYSNLDTFFEKIIDLNVLSYSKLQQENYRPILQTIGLDETRLLEHLLQIDEIEDKEEKELAMEQFVVDYPNNIFVLFKRAYLTALSGQIKKSRFYYRRVLEINPQYAYAHYNLGILLSDHFNEYEDAKKHYKKVIEIDPLYVWAHIRLANLLSDHFNEYEEAKRHYEKAIEIDPLYVWAHIRLANLLSFYFNEYDEAKKHFEKAIEIDPQSVWAHIRLNSFLQDNSINKEEDKKSIEQPFPVDPLFKISRI